MFVIARQAESRSQRQQVLVIHHNDWPVKCIIVAYRNRQRMPAGQVAATLRNAYLPIEVNKGATADEKDVL
eukprot:scaffold316990_cov18-Prasinocladus_malaysianus.AAC.1